MNDDAGHEDQRMVEAAKREQAEEEAADASNQ